MATIKASIDNALHDAAQAVLARIGMDTETAVRLLLRQIVIDQRFPFKPADPFDCDANIRHLEKVLDDVRHKRNLTAHDMIEVD